MVKRIALLPTLVLCGALVVSACNGNKPGNNNNGAPPSTPTPTDDGGNGNNTVGGKKPDQEKDVQININPDPRDPNKCVIVDPGDVTVAFRRNKVRWTVINNCPAANTATVILEGFKKVGGSDRDPFGAGSCDNTFTFDPIKVGEEGRLITRTPKKDGIFKYVIKVVLPDGRVLSELDPQVIVTRDIN